MIIRSGLILGRMFGIVYISFMSGSTGIFIHIPKTAGKTLKSSFGSYFPLMYGKHCTLRFIYSKDPSIIGKPVITCIRNPYERIYSLYRYTKALRYHNLKFEEWLYSPVVNGKHEHYTDIKIGNPLISKTYIVDENEDLYDNIFIIQFENLKNDFNQAVDYFKIKKKFELKTNFGSIKNLGRDYKKNMGSEHINYISDICSWEIELFNYKF